MRFKCALLSGLLAAVIAMPVLVQAEPLRVPSDKLAYVGDWKGKDMELIIAESGKITYKRVSPEKKVDLNIELISFVGDSFIAGYGIFNSHFDVSSPPRLRDKKMRMVVDGVELIKMD